MKRMNFILTFLLGHCTITLLGQTADYEQYILKQNLPDCFRNRVECVLDNQFKLSSFINPFYLLADFNGDKKTDIALAVKEVKTGKTGIIIFHAETQDYYVIGAGNKIGKGGDNFDWLDIWRIYKKDFLKPGIGETKTVNLLHEALFVGKAESASAVIFWTGTNYEWYQQGD